MPYRVPNQVTFPLSDLVRVESHRYLQPSVFRGTTPDTPQHRRIRGDEIMDAIEGIAVVIAGLIIGFLAIRAVWIDLTILAEHDRYELELALAEEAAEREQLTYVELVETD